MAGKVEGFKGGVAVNDKVQVQVTIRARWEAGAIVEMTREQFDALDARLNARPRGFAMEQLAEDIMDTAQIQFRDGDIDDFEVEDFYIDESGAP